MPNRLGAMRGSCIHRLGEQGFEDSFVIAEDCKVLESTFSPVLREEKYLELQGYKAKRSGLKTSPPTVKPTGSTVC